MVAPEKTHLNLSVNLSKKKMTANFSTLKNLIRLKQWKDLRYGLLFTLSFFAGLDRGQVRAQATGGTGGSCVGWLCGPKNSLTTAFPDGSTIINVGFVLMQGVVLAVLVGIAVVVINRIASREDYGAPMATFFGTVLILLAINFLGGYLFNIGATTP